MEGFRDLRLPEELVQAIEEHLAELGAASAEEYVEAVVRERLLSEGIIAPYGEEDSKKLEDRLRDLGYID